MPSIREVQTCGRCRESKKRCDKTKPACLRCRRMGAPCIYDASPIVAQEGGGLMVSEVSSHATSPDDDTSGQEKAVKRRDRATLSCVRCHRLKVKCDKKHPHCGRCSRLGFGKDCVYTHRAQESSSTPLVLEGEDAAKVLALFFLRKRGSSHWRTLLSRLPAAPNCDYTWPLPWLSMAVQAHSHSDCTKNVALPGNFPFGSAESIRYCSPQEVHKLLDMYQGVAPHWLAGYLNLHHPSNPLFDVRKLEDEVHQFWESREQFTVGWIALYLAVLGLGANAAGVDDKTCAQLFFASEACLARTPYMCRPTLANVRTLCLMITAKQMSFATCWALDACWSIMGMIVRLSLMLGLHIPQTDKMSPTNFEERDFYPVVWNTAVKLDMGLSLVTGQVSLLPPNAFGVRYSNREAGIETSGWDLVSTSYPIVYNILTRVNTSTNLLTYDEVLQYDLQLRTIMRETLPTISRASRIQRITTDIFFRRVLMILHRQYALDASAPSLYPTSYWSSLECSLALIVHFRTLSGRSHGVPENASVLTNPFMLDFFGAALTACLHLQAVDAPLVPDTSQECMIPPRQTMLDTMEDYLEISAQKRGVSVCYDTGYRILSAVYGMLPEKGNTE